MRKLFTFLIALGAIVFAIVFAVVSPAFAFGYGFQGGCGGYNSACAGGSTPFAITNTDFASDTTTQTTYNFSARNFAIGSADPSRLVVVVVAARQAGTVGAASGVLINGSAASLVVSGANSANPAGATSTLDIYQLAVPTGTTATVAVTYPSAMLRAGCAVYSVLGSNGVVPSGAAIATYAGAVTTSPTASITGPAGGGTILGAGLSASTGATPTNYTQDQSVAVSTLWFVAGHDTAHSGSTSYTVTTTGAGNDPVGAFAAWAP